MNLIQQIANLFKSTDQKLERIKVLESDLLGIRVVKDLLIEQYTDIQKALNCDDFTCKDDLNFSEKDYIRQMAGIKSSENRVLKELDILKSDSKVNLYIQGETRSKAVKIIKSLYQSGKLGLDEYSHAIGVKDEEGRVKYADVIVTNNKNEILLQKRNQWEDEHKGVWVVPGGHVDKGEDFETAAKRELLEEMGISVDKLIREQQQNNTIIAWNKVGIAKEPKAHIEYYNLQIQNKEDIEILLDEKESRDYLWVPVEELKNYPMIFNMRKNVMKAMNWVEHPNVTIIQKAIRLGIIPIDRVIDISKALHKKKVIVHKKDGKTHLSTRMVKDEEGLPPLAQVKENIHEVMNYLTKDKDPKDKNINFTKITDYANQVIKGERYLKRLYKEEEQGRIRGSIRNVEASILLGTSEEPNHRFLKRNEQLKLLREYAQSAGCWVEDYTQIYSNVLRIAERTESEVFSGVDDNIGYVIKINNFSQHEDIAEMFDRISIQNILFEDAFYEVLGFTERYGEINIILKQPFIQMKVDEDNHVIKPDRDRLKLLMESFGFESQGGNLFTSENYIVEDLHPGNVCLNMRDEIVFFDPVIRINTHEEGQGGDRFLGKITLEEPKDIEKAMGDISDLYIMDRIDDELYDIAKERYVIQREKQEQSIEEQAEQTNQEVHKKWL